MERLNSWFGLFVGQGLVVFVGVVILLGRTFSQSYFEALGIPPSAVSLNVVDYALFAPNITLLGILMSSLVPASAIAMTMLTPERSFGRPWFYVGGAMILAPLFMITPNVERLTVAAPLFVMMTIPGVLFLARSLPLPRTYAMRNRLRILVTGLFALTFVICFVSTYAYSQAVAKIHADKVLVEAPRARVDLTPEVQGLFRSADTGVAQKSSDCIFRVILIGDKFIYLRPVSPPMSGVYAVPVEDVERIYYLPED